MIKFRREGTDVELIGLNEASQAMIEKFGVHDKPDAEQSLDAH
jgi:SulP family sulfate permease